MSDYGTAEAAGRQDGPREDGSYARPTGPGRWLRMYGDGILATYSGAPCGHPCGPDESWWPHAEAVAKLTAPSPALGPSSPPPPSREEQIKAAAQKAAEAVLRDGWGRGVAENACLYTAQHFFLEKLYRGDLTDRIASALRSCWPSAAEGEGGPEPALESRTPDGYLAGWGRVLDSVKAPPGDIPTITSRIQALASERDAALSGLAAAREAQDAAERERDELRVYREAAKRREEYWEKQFASGEAERRRAGIKALNDWTAKANEVTALEGRVEELEAECAAAEGRAEEAERQRDEAREKANELYAQAHELDSAHEKLNRNGIGGEDDPLWQRLDILLDKAECAALRARPASLPPLPKKVDCGYLRTRAMNARDGFKTQLFGPDGVALLALLDYVEALPAVLSASSPAPSPLCVPGTGEWVAAAAQ